MSLIGLIVLCIVVGGVWLGSKLIFGMVRAWHHAKHAASLRYILIKMPRMDGEQDKGNDAIQSMKQNIEIMGQIYKNFTAIYSKSFLDTRFGQPYIVCEMMVEKEMIKFHMAFPKDFVETFEKVISSFFPGAVIDPIPYPKLLHAGKFAAGGSFVLTKDSALPIKTYENFEADPMDSVLASFARVGVDEKLCFQVVLAPLSDQRQQAVRKKIEALKSGKNEGRRSFLKETFRDPKKDTEKSGDKQSEYSSSQISDIEKKAIDEGFHTILRGLAISDHPDRPEKMMKDLERSLNQYNYTGLNSLSFVPEHDEFFIKTFLLRAFTRPLFHRKDGLKRAKEQILNIKELASLFHLPHSRINKNPRLVWQKFKIVPAPDDLSNEGILLGNNLYGGVKKDIKLGFEDRFRHFYIIGQTGTGKSSIFRTMLHQDMAAGNGFTLIDPHGDLAEGCLDYFPKEHIDKLVYRDAGNDELPFGFNFLNAKNEREMDLVTNDAVDMFVQLYGHEIFGPRIQDYFRNAVLLLMEQPEGGTLVEIVRLFTDPAFQKVKLKNVTNPVVRSWWEKTYGAMGDREKGEMIPYFQAKFGPFTTTPLLRNIIGQPQSSFDMSEIMDQGKCLIMNLSKGKLGDINANLLGLMIVSQVRICAFRRAFQEEHARVPHFLYIDEFQNFVTPAIESILSEARKYRLGLVIANQYLDQLEKPGLGGNTNLKHPIFGNVGNMMCYRIGVKDTEEMAEQFAPKFSASDLLNLDKFKGVIKMSVDMQPTPAFSINVKKFREDPKLNTPEKTAIIKQISALKYGRKKELVDKEIYYRVGV